MKKFIYLASAIWMVLFLAFPALAQTSRNPCYINATGGCTPVGTSSPLPTTIISGGGGGQTDQSAFTEGSTQFVPSGGVFNDAATLSSGEQGTQRLTTKRAAIIDVDTSGNALYTAMTSAIPAGTNRIGYASDDPCANKTKTNKQFTTNGTSSVELVAVSGSTTIYVCSLAFIVSSASKVAFTTGTGTACATGNAAVIGSTTANIANSMSFAANGGMTLGNGGGTIAKGAASSAFCMINSVDQYTSGNITYVQE